MPETGMPDSVVALIRSHCLVRCTVAIFDVRPLPTAMVISGRSGRRPSSFQSTPAVRWLATPRVRRDAAKTAVSHKSGWLASR